MDVTALIMVLVWLIVGFAWTRYWYTEILDNHRYTDTGAEVGPFMLIMMTLTGPMFVALASVLFVGEAVFTKTGPFIKKMYGG